MNNWFKRNSIHFIIAAIFLVICFIYFTPAFQGKTLGQNDVTRAQSTQKEINDYRAKDTTILWTNQIYGGMPAYQIWAPYKANLTSWVVNAINYSFPSPVGTILIFLLGGYLLFSVLKLNPWLAAAGSVAFTFSSYNIILLVAGHANQAFAIAFFAPILAGILLILRGKHFIGAAVTALALALEIRANHVQMTYYLLLVLLILVFIELYHAIKNKTTANFLKSLAYVGAAVVLALAVNASMLWSTYEYGKDTIRGKSNLTQHTTEPSNGLPKDYAYQWSQGVGECITFLIPNAYGGGGRGPSDADSHVAKALIDKGAPADQAVYIAQNAMPLYWGEKPFTEGPFYFGAVICFLFIWGLFIVKNRIKWWLLGAVIFTMLLSFGKNWPYVSDLFFNYFPLYNKFRAVESILAVAGLCFPILALLAVNEAIVNENKADLFKKLKITFYITGGISLVIAVIPSLFLSFKPSNQLAYIDQLSQMLKIDNATASSLAQALVEDRASVAQADALRSLIFVALTFAIAWAFIKKKINVTVLSVAFLALILVDMWTVDKRYLNNDSFAPKQDNNTPQPREVDQFILKDKDPDFRVIDLTQSIKGDGITPFFYKSIGGYSAARLKRFEEVVDEQLTKSINHEVLDMLNTKYIITQDPKTQNLAMQANQTACGHAWFVKSIKYADNADQEMQAISSFDPKNEAIVDKQYKSAIDEKSLGNDPAGKIDLISYNPDHMIYQSGSTASQIAVFSEVYYNKGWKMLIDGVEKPYFRANYLLRAAQIPVGNHKIEFIFHPTSYYAGENISLAGSILLVLALGGAIYTETKKKPAVKPAAKKA
jgi:ABC-type multidrug transport system fused ATPase/permease subunit